MTDYLAKYSKGTPKFQEGGAMPAGAPAEGGAPAEQGAGDPMAQLQQMVAQYAQTRDPQLAVAIADALVAAMGSGAPTGAPAPAMSNGGSMSAPMFKKGGVLA